MSGLDRRIHAVTGDEWRAALAAAQDAGRLWMLVVEHADGQLEMCDSRGYGIRLTAHLDYSMFGSFLLAERPVECDAAIAAGLGPLDRCGRCGGDGKQAHS